MSRERETGEQPSPVAFEQLDIEVASRTDVAALLRMYNDPSIRLHLIYPPQHHADLIDDAGGGSQLFVARNNADIVGAVTLRPIGAATVGDALQVEVARLAVSPDETKQGIGTRLLERALDHAFTGETQIATLGILGDAPGWEVADTMYRDTFGFVPVGTRIEPYRDLGPVQHFDQPPIPTAQLARAPGGGVHYISANVPIHSLAIGRARYLRYRGKSLGSKTKCTTFR